MKLAIGSDHAGFLLKEKIKAYLQQQEKKLPEKSESAKRLVKDFGCYSEDRVDYPDFAHSVAEGVERKDFDFGILICGSGNGISMAANKHKGIRSAICWNEELAKLARQHNDANIIALPARFISEDEAMKCVDVFLSEKFEGGRHTERVKKIEENYRR